MSVDNRTGKWPGLLFSLLVLTQPATGKEITGHHHAGDRVGTHGMALFGKTVHYLAHIPMMKRPHNEQLIMRVSLSAENGEELAGDFSQEGHSLRPTGSFSLDDLVVGAIGSFEADVFRGNFEHGAPRIHRNVTVVVDEVIVARNLEESAGSEGELFYLLGREESWLLNVITPARNRQEILPTKVVTPAPGLSDDFALKVSVEESDDGARAVLRKAGQPSPEEGPELTEIQLEPAPSIWCLDGPDFFQRCGQVADPEPASP